MALADAQAQEPTGGEDEAIVLEGLAHPAMDVLALLEAERLHDYAVGHGRPRSTISFEVGSQSLAPVRVITQHLDQPAQERSHVARGDPEDEDQVVDADTIRHPGSDASELTQGAYRRVVPGVEQLAAPPLDQLSQLVERRSRARRERGREDLRPKVEVSRVELGEVRALLVDAEEDVRERDQDDPIERGSRRHPRARRLGAGGSQGR
ncbi:MAG TPA: hypothetical protein VHR17_03420 [Thermoanaerobaculia bacterium]|nr:hypothetical protein [Thermoanaerobaculia bacterium]